MKTRAVLLGLAFLAGCATAEPQPAPDTGATVPDAAGTAPSAGPSDWALAVVGTPFVFAFRTVVCAATAVMAGPTAGFLALSDYPREGLAYVRDGLAQNCGPPYGVPVPVAAGYDTEPYARYDRTPFPYYDPTPDSYYYPAPEPRYYPEPDAGEPRPLIPSSSAAVTSP